ncbi:MAG: lysoplasmalogenase [Saccharospirillum sp.]|nr:lysoplasmalogenase [Saccharospirillum sp.]
MTRQASWIFGALALAYLVSMALPTLPVHWFIKALPIWWLASVVVVNAAFPGRWVLLGALLMSSLGDVLLAFDLFVYGLAAFLVAQLIYAFLFGRSACWRLERLGWLLYLLLWALCMIALIQPQLGELSVPVYAYLVAIMLMGSLALMSHYALWPGFAGAAIFILSDSLIALGLFQAPLPGHGWWVMMTYYLAQWLLTRTFLEQGRVAAEQP